MPKAKTAKQSAKNKEIIFEVLPDRSAYFKGIKYAMDADKADHYIKMGFAKEVKK